MTNDEGRMMESLREIFFKTNRSTQKLMTDRIHCSMFDLLEADPRGGLARLWRFGRSMFDVHQFLFRFTRLLFGPAAVLNPEP